MNIAPLEHRIALMEKLLKRIEPGTYYPGTMDMSKSDWAKLHSKEIQVVKRGIDVLAAVWTTDNVKDQDQCVFFAACATLVPDLIAEYKRMKARMEQGK